MRFGLNLHPLAGARERFRQALPFWNRRFSARRTSRACRATRRYHGEGRIYRCDRTFPQVEGSKKGSSREFESVRFSLDFVILWKSTSTRYALYRCDYKCLLSAYFGAPRYGQWCSTIWTMCQYTEVTKLSRARNSHRALSSVRAC